MYYGAVKDQTPEEVETITVEAFSGDEKWDCSGTPEQTLKVDQTDLDTACSNNSLYTTSNGNNWIDCSNTF